jgi:hypothetical protein
LRTAPANVGSRDQASAQCGTLAVRDRLAIFALRWSPGVIEARHNGLCLTGASPHP